MTLLKSINLGKNKIFELQIETLQNSKIYNVFEFSFKRTDRQDHAGTFFVFGIRSLIFINAGIYDSRHWDENTNNWQV